jgi:ERF superfamily
MATEIEEYHEPAAPALSQSNSLFEQIVSAAKDPTVQPEKMQAMVDLAVQLQDREQRQEFNRDLNAAIMEMPVITKTGRIIIKDKNTGKVLQSTPFAKFEDLDRVVKSIVKRHNLSYNFDVGGDAQRLLVSIILRHANGYVERSSPMPLPLETSGSKNNVQGAGSTNTYGKRYVLQNTFAIVTEGEDDDGNGGTAVAMPLERETLIMEEAQTAFDAGSYAGWYRHQSPKDRAWLVAQGLHAEFMASAAPALQGPESVKTHEKSQAVAAKIKQAKAAKATKQDKPDHIAGAGNMVDLPDETVDERVIEQDSGPPAPPTAEEQAAAQRLGWVRNYVADVEACQSLDALTELQKGSADRLTKIRDSYADLQEIVLAAHKRAFERLKPADEGADLFGGDS